MIVAGIFARGDSKGVPNKNLRIVAGKSLTHRAVEHAIYIKGVTNVYCSTDSIQIADEASNHGAIVPWLRPSELAQDNSKEWDSWSHLVIWLNSKKNLPKISSNGPYSIATSNIGRLKFLCRLGFIK